MKKLQFILTCAMLALIAACANPEKALPRKDGIWDVTKSRVKTTIDGVVDSDVTATSGNGYFTFTKTGYTSHAVDGTTSSGTWSYNKDKEEITLIEDGASSVFKVTEAKKTSESWSNTITATSASYTITQLIEIEISRRK